MSVANFLSKENIITLWDVINDEEIFRYLSKNDTNSILELFQKNLKGFYESERIKTGDLINMNKKYILLIMNHIKNNYQTKQPVKIKIHEDIPINKNNEKELITYEEIQNDRKSQFERDLNKRQEEFTNAMALPLPDVPDFSDKLNDKPITEMEKMIEEMKAQRNYEVETINKTFTPSNIQNETNNWLKSQDTSIKNEKIIQPIQKPSIVNLENNTKLKYIKIDNNEITLNSPIEQKKNVTWGTNQTKEFLNDEDDKILEENIFNKLKKVPSVKNNMNNITQNTYEERLQFLEENLLSLNDKIETIIDILKNK